MDITQGQTELFFLKIYQPLAIRMTEYAVFFPP